MKSKPVTMLDAIYKTMLEFKAQTGKIPSILRMHPVTWRSILKSNEAREMLRYANCANHALLLYGMNVEEDSDIMPGLMVVMNSSEQLLEKDNEGKWRLSAKGPEARPQWPCRVLVWSPLLATLRRRLRSNRIQPPQATRHSRNAP